MKNFCSYLAVLCFLGSLAFGGERDIESWCTKVAGDESPNAALPQSDWQGIRAAYMVGRHRVRAGALTALNQQHSWAMGAIGQVSPVAQDVYLKASNTGYEDSFGWSVAVSGNVVVVGAPLESSASTGINGNQADDSAQYAGAAYVFVKVGGIWVQEAYLKAANTGVWDQFAWSLALDGDTLVVGARGEWSDATGVNGDPNNNNAPGSGAAYVFRRTGTTWVQEAYLKASNTGSGDQFGFGVSISGDRIAVGAFGEDSKSAGVGGGQMDDSLPNAGAAYLFDRIGSTWSQQGYFKASNPGQSNGFGISVGVSGSVLVAGAFAEHSSGIGVNGTQNENGAMASGAAYIFELGATGWFQRAYLKPIANHHSTWFGEAVAVSNGTVVVGAWGERLSKGSVYVYEKSGTDWFQQAWLRPTTSRSGDIFGHSVAISDDVILAGAFLEYGVGIGVNGDPRYAAAADSTGSAYIFRRVGQGWQESTYLKASNPDIGDTFGHAVAISGDLVVVGATGEDSAASGPYGLQSNNSAMWSGAAYVFNIESEIATYCGPATVNSSGLAGELSGSGSLAIQDNDFTLRADGVPPGQVGYFLSSMGHDFVPNPGGSQGHLCLGRSFIARHNRSHEIRMAGANGAFELILDLQDMPAPMGVAAVLSGETWNFQAWFRDQNPGATSNFTNALSVRFH